MKSKFKITKETIRTLDSLWELERIILDTLDFNSTVQKIVDSILLELGYLNLGYKVVVLALIDDSGENLKRVALSHTKEAKKTREVSEIPFEQIIIPMTANKNLCIKTIKENKPQITHSFPDILTPPITEENALASQRNAGIKTSMVYPLTIKGDTIGVMIFSMIKNENEVTDEEKILLKYFTSMVALAVQNSRIYSDLEKKTHNLELANFKLKQLDQIKDEFISITSHELKTPMSIIKSYLWMLDSERNGELNEKQKYYISRAKNATERMINLITDMLNISRLQSGKLQFNIKKANIKKIIDDTVEEFEFKLKKKNLKLIMDIEEPIDTIYTDPSKLREIMTNLISNATKYTDEGTITIKVKQIDNNFIKVLVVDTGRGISEEESRMLFHKFQRLDNSYTTIAQAGGTGLGLYIIKLYISPVIS